MRHFGLHIRYTLQIEGVGHETLGYLKQVTISYMYSTELAGRGTIERGRLASKPSITKAVDFKGRKVEVV